MLGQMVIQGTQYAQGLVTVDVSSIADGAYILSMTSANGVMSKNKIDIRHGCCIFCAIRKCRRGFECLQRIIKFAVSVWCTLL